MRVKVIFDSKQGDIINQYIIFCRVFDEQVKLYGRTEKAVRETIRICKNRNVLKEYLAKEEVSTIMFGLMDRERLLEISNMWMREEAQAEGRAEGKKSMARGLFKSGIDLEAIALSAGVPVEQVKKLISEPEPEPTAG